MAATQQQDNPQQDATTQGLRLSRPLAFLDTEWTDLNPEERRLVSIAITRMEPDGSTTARSWRVNPRRPISDSAARVHGIRNKDLAGLPSFRAIAPEVEAMLQDADLAGYNLAGDIETIEKEMKIAGHPWTAEGLWLVDAYRLWQAREPRTLSDAHARFVGPLPDDAKPHDAEGDVDITVAVITAMAQGSSVEELHNEAHPQMVDPGGKFRRENGIIVYNFGPHRGAPVSEHPDYLEWMLTKSFAPSTMATARRLLRDSYSGNAAR